jgi:hypothetical protein
MLVLALQKRAHRDSASAIIPEALSRMIDFELARLSRPN